MPVERDYLGQNTKQEEPDATSIASTARRTSGEGQHSIVLGKGGVGQTSRQCSKEAVDTCTMPTQIGNCLYGVTSGLHGDTSGMLGTCQGCMATRQGRCDRSGLYGDIAGLYGDTSGSLRTGQGCMSTSQRCMGTREDCMPLSKASLPMQQICYQQLLRSLMY